MNLILRFLLWLDIKLFVVVTFGNCRPGETISAASWSLKLDNKVQGRIAVPTIDFLARLFGDGVDHCHRAYIWQANLYPKDTSC